MKNKFKILAVFIVLAFSLSIMSNTYSRYIADTTGDIEMIFAKWQILINDDDITSGNTTSIDITPVIIENENIAANKLAPTSTGYYDIEIDPSNVELSFTYTISILGNEDMPDLIVDRYAIITEDTNLNTLVPQTISNNVISGSLDFDKTISNFSFEPFTVRLYFEWYDGVNESMDDDDDTSIATLNESVSILTNISFEQNLN